jgi:Zn-dependent protease/CBS domain-containing protein
MRPSITLVRIAGIDIGIHYTWLFVAALVAWSLAQGYFPSLYPGWEATTYWVAGVVAALALFGSVLLHELSHSLVAIWRGIRVRSITLFIFGGVSTMEEETEQPQDEFLIAVVGPLASVLLAGLFWVGFLLVPDSRSAPAAILAYLAFLNVLLAGFNLLPGFPLDGGRMLRAIIWGVTGRLRRATQIAAFIGQGLGFLLIIWGFSQVLGGAVLNGIWIAFIGWFLTSAAETERRGQALRETLKGISVSRVMDPQPPLASIDLSVQAFVDEHVFRRGQRALLVVDDGYIAGLVSVSDVKAIPQEAWPTTPIAQIMTRPPLTTVSPDDGLDTVLRRLVQGSFNQVPVVDQGRFVGLLSRADILRFLENRELLGIERRPTGRTFDG